MIAELLDEQFGVAVTFRPTVTVHIERIAGTGASFAIMAEKTTPYLATLGFRVEPASVGSGLACDLEVERGSMPPAFFAATWEGVRYGLAQGLSGWPIPDARVVLTHTGYSPRQSPMHQKFNKNMSSVGADFRNLAPVLIHEALRQARTVVCEPVETFHLEIPVSALPAVTVTVARLSGFMTGAAPVGDARRSPARCPPEASSPCWRSSPSRQRRRSLHLGGDPLHTRRGTAPLPAEVTAPTPWTGRSGSARSPLTRLRGRSGREPVGSSTVLGGCRPRVRVRRGRRSRLHGGGEEGGVGAADADAEVA